MNRVAYMDGIRNISFDILPMPVPKTGEVLVKIEYVGVCGSDLHYYKHGRIGPYVVEGKFILGHECSGTVVALGENVQTLAVGDRVALEPGITCGKCEYCKSGKYNLCPRTEFFATPPYQGTFCDYIAYSADMCFKLPDNVSAMEGALVEPLAVGLHAANQGGVALGDTVVILGSGCIGLVTLISSLASGASTVISVDVLKKKLDYAKKLGATHVINAMEQDVAVEIQRLTNGRGADVIYEAAANEKTIGLTSFIARPGGTIVLIGIPASGDVPYNFSNLISKEITVKTVCRYRNLYPAAISSISNGIIDVKSIVTHEFSFEKIKQALDSACDNGDEVVKAVIRIN